eukprot:g9035.t1
MIASQLEKSMAELQSGTGVLEKDQLAAETSFRSSMTEHGNTTASILRMEAICQVLNRMATQIVDEMEALPDVQTEILQAMTPSGASSFAQLGATATSAAAHERQSQSKHQSSPRPLRAFAAGTGAPTSDLFYRRYSTELLGLGSLMVLLCAAGGVWAARQK